MTSEQSWTSDFPTEEGRYWFYGDPHMGQMGSDYKDEPCRDFELYCVKVIKVSNGVMGIVEGQFMPKNQFDKEKRIPGYLGKFTPAIIPELPGE